MIVFDTNIWVYLHDSRDPAKQAKAQNLYATVRSLCLPWQVGCEFIAACRKLVVIGFSEDDAWLALADMRRSVDEIFLPVPLLWTETDALRKRFSLSIWDALLVAACLRENVTTLYTENFAGLAKIDSMTLINPFTTP